MTKYIFSFFLFFLPLCLITQTPLINTIFVISFAIILLLSQLFNPQKITYNKLVLFFFLSVILSFVFSKNILLSLWGKGGESLIAFVSIFIIFSFVRKENMVYILKFFVLGTIFSVVYFFIQKFIGHEVLNTSQLAITVALSLLILISRYKDKIIIAPALLFFAFLFFIDINIAWFILSVGTFLIFYKELVRFNFEIKKTMPLLLALIIFLTCFFVPLPLGQNKNIGEISYTDSMSIAQNSSTESFNNLFFGSGLSTYHYQFSLYKNKEVNLINPYLVAKEGSSMILTFVVTMGLLGLISLLTLLLFLYFKGFRNFFNDKDFIFPIVFTFSLLFFFYRIDIFLILIFFILLGFWAKGSRETSVNKIFIVGLLVFLSFGAFNYYNYIKADRYYQRSLDYFSSREPLRKSINEAEKSIELFNLSDYYIALSKLYLLNASQYFEEKWVTKEKIKEQKELIQENIILSEKYAKKAVEIDKNNFQAWQKLGLLYENINFFIEKKTDDIIYNYEKAKQLAPQNYDIYYAIGRVLEEDGKKDLALKEYQKALELNPNDDKLIKKIETWED